MISLLVIIALLVAITRIKATFMVWTAVIGGLLLLATVACAWPTAADLANRARSD